MSAALWCESSPNQEAPNKVFGQYVLRWLVAPCSYLVQGAEWHKNFVSWLVSQTAWGHVSDPTTLKEAYTPTSFVCPILNDMTNPSTVEAIHSGLWLLPKRILWPPWAVCMAITTDSPSSASSLTMVRVRSSNCSIGNSSMLEDAFNSCFTQTRNPATIVYSGNPPSRTTNFFSSAKKTSTVLPAINVLVVKHSYAVQGFITKTFYSTDLVSTLSAFWLSLKCW